jgi:hypothetical protein
VLLLLLLLLLCTQMSQALHAARTDVAGLVCNAAAPASGKPAAWL